MQAATPTPDRLPCPSPPAADAANVNPRAFREALSTFATGVTIVTTEGVDGEPVGVTANSFNSVSLDPPLVLWSLAKASRSLNAFQSTRHWAVHILAADQEDLSARFARSGDDKFAELDWNRGHDGVPLIAGCSARLQCRAAHCYEGGDHMILVGEVLAFERSEAAPLLFHGGRYAVATRKTPPLAPRQISAAGSDGLGYLLWRASEQFHLKLRRHLAARDLSQEDFFVLAVLFHRDELPIAALRTRWAQFDFEYSPARLATLEHRGLLRTSIDGERLVLMPEGRDEAARAFAILETIESDCLGRIGAWDATSFKNLLVHFISRTNPGVPHPWEDDTAETVQCT
jgi:3-hydroxy-9,10-secoandrosta-1,3,5(10)-triene-9,17-dione monooxygenase reductase component